MSSFVGNTTLKTGKNMIKTEELKELVKTIFYTGYVENEKPLSFMLIGKVGTGKTEILNSFSLNDNVAFFTDITYMGLIKLLSEQKEVRHIVIPDFLKITMKKKSTTENITSCFNAMMEEGLEKISMMGQSFDFKGKKVGLITATTLDSFAQHRKGWNKMGFLSRMLIVSFSYKDETIKEIFDYIFNRKYIRESKRKEIMPIRNVEVNLTPELSKLLKDKDTSFRRQKQLQTLSMARALVNNRTEVIKEDIDWVNRIAKKYLNMNFTKI